jgi:hypothetical protein
MPPPSRRWHTLYRGRSAPDSHRLPLQPDGCLSGAGSKHRSASNPSSAATMAQRAAVSRCAMARAWERVHPTSPTASHRPHAIHTPTAAPRRRRAHRRPRRPAGGAPAPPAAATVAVVTGVATAAFANASLCTTACPALGVAPVVAAALLVSCAPGSGAHRARFARRRIFNGRQPTRRSGSPGMRRARPRVAACCSFVALDPGKRAM